MRSSYFASLLVLAFFAPTAPADDWPQWLGPQRDGVWRETGLMTAFPKGGLKIIWRVPVGVGYAGAAVGDGLVFVMERQMKNAKADRTNWGRITSPGDERVLCVDEKTGKPLWVYAYDCPYSISYGAGPRTTPAVDGNRVYTLGAEGDLYCIDIQTGKPIWSHHLSGEKVIVLSCGINAATGPGLVTAFNKMTGKMLWTALGAKVAGYAPPMICQAGGKRQLIIWCPDSVNSLDPETGKVYWTQPHGPLKNGVTIATPRFVHDPKLGDLLFVSSAYEGALVMKPDPTAPKASIFWKRGGTSERRTDALHLLMAPPTLRDGYVYGVGIGGALRCLDLRNGNRIWSTYDATTGDVGRLSWANAFLIPLGDAGPHFLLANEHGDLILADLTPQGYHETSRTHLLDPTNTDAGRPVVWCHPALADRCVFWRNDKEMICASIAAK